MQKAIVLIPALEPNENLVRLVRELRGAGFDRLIVIDDGSSFEHTEVFSQTEKEGCIVAHHTRNIGKGAALKTGIKTAVQRFGAGNTYITADADGQHLTGDILKVSEELERFPDMLVLGVRDFGSDSVPLRSLVGNRITAVFFRLTSGIACPDTQTGLRGIPECLENFALAEDGNRYEYEMNFLSDAARLVEFRYVPIHTVYNGANKASHFRPVVDSVMVYGRFLRFAAASLAGAAADYLLFFIFTVILMLPQIPKIFLAAVLARIGSGIVNFTLNRYFCFHSRSPIGKEAIRYGILFFCQMCISAGLVSILSLMLPQAVVGKLIVDTVLFFVSFVVQKNWVFQRSNDEKIQQ